MPVPNSRLHSTHTTMRDDRNEEIPTAIGEADRRCMCHEQNKLISTAIDEGEEPESVAVGTQSDHCQRTVLQSLNDVVNFNLFISLIDSTRTLVQQFNLQTPQWVNLHDVGGEL